MRRPSPDDAELKAAIRRYVVPETDGIARYLWLLGADFTYMEEPARTAFLRQLAAAARQASDRELATLLDSEWRSRLTASWLIGLDRREQFRARIGEQLLSSELTYAGQGYCLALARFVAVGGLWQQWDTLGQTPAQLRDRISDLCSMAKESMRPD